MKNEFRLMFIPPSCSGHHTARTTPAGGRRRDTGPAPHRGRRVTPLSHSNTLRSAVLLIVLLFALPACTQARDVRAILDADLHPPRLVSAELVDARTAEIRFNKPAGALPDTFRLEPAGEFHVSEREDYTLTVTLDEDSEPGTRYTLAGAAADENGNSLQFVVYLYGYNPSMPEVQINEFSTRRSSNHPEIAELLVLTDGNLGGMTVTRGTSGDFDSRYVFPGVEVSAGDYVLVHFRPEGTEAEVDELGGDLTLSGGLNASDDARDVWVPGGEGLSSNNGVVVLYESPGGGVLDAAPYTNRTSESDERYAGFGSSRFRSQVEQLVEEGAWTIAGTHPRPEDIIYVDDSTATRSMNRTPDATNTRSHTDWHTAPTSGSTWGEENTTRIYVP